MVEPSPSRLMPICAGRHPRGRRDRRSVPIGRIPWSASVSADRSRSRGIHETAELRALQSAGGSAVETSFADFLVAYQRTDGWRPDPSQEGVGRLTVVRQVVRANQRPPADGRRGSFRAWICGWRARI